MERLNEKLKYLVVLTKTCRNAQKRYFKTRAETDLTEARKAEAELDKYLVQLDREAEPKLF